MKIIKTVLAIILAFSFVLVPIETNAAGGNVGKVGQLKPLKPEIVKPEILAPGLIKPRPLAEPDSIEILFIIGDMKYKVNKVVKQMDTKPIIIEGRTLLPIRYVAEPLGAQVGWEQSTKKVTIKLGNDNIEMWIGNPKAKVNGVEVPIDSANSNIKPRIIDSRTMIPVRFISENLGCQVGWDGTIKQVRVFKSGLQAYKPVPLIPELEFKPLIPELGKPKLSEQLEKLQRDFVVSGNLTNISEDWSKAPKNTVKKVKSTESNLPVVMRLGRGYDVFGEYASVNSLKHPVLDIDKLVNDGRVERIRLDVGENYQTASQSIKEYSQKMSMASTMGGGYLCFSGSVSTNFDSGRTSRLNNYFSTYSYIVKKYGVYINGATNLKNYLLPEVRQYINSNNNSAADVFGNYGEYVLIDSITGGRVDHSISAEAKKATSFENFKLATKASFNALVFRAGGSASFQNVKNRSEYESTKDERLKSQGGKHTLNIGQFKNNPNTLANWEATLEKNGTLVEFGKTGARALVPIWELCDNSARANYLKREFDKINDSQKEVWPTQKYISDIAIVTDKKEHRARAKCPMGYILIDRDLNIGAKGHFIYLCYKLTENPNRAITDLFVELTGSSQNAVTATRSHNGNIALYSRIPVDLNKGSGGKFIYLWKTKTKNRSPLTALDVIFSEPNDAHKDWQSAKWFNSQTPADLNKTVKGKFITLLFKR